MKIASRTYTLSIERCSAELLDAAVSPDGKILAVGRASTDDGGHAGWTPAVRISIGL